jgi:CBS domain containing-hemolysin-like protein
MISDIALTLFFVVLNGFFVAAEFAIVKVRASQIELRVREGNKMAKIAQSMVTHLDGYLSATQLGITLASLGLGWIGESVVAQIVINTLELVGINLNPESAHQIALPLSFALITFLHIVFGELAPKSLAIQYSEQVALSVSFPLRLFYIIFKPAIWVLNNFANMMLRIIGVKPPSEGSEMHSPEELKYIIAESSRSGMIDDTEQKMIENVFDFAETQVKQIMIPRNKIIAVEVNMSKNETIDTIIEEGYSRMPVYEGNIDNIIGMVFAKDILRLLKNSEDFRLKDILRKPYFVSEDSMIDDLLRSLQKRKMHIAVVLNEFGGTAGLVTLEDILEEIVGEIQDEYDEELPLLKKLSEKEYSISAQMIIDDANDFLPIDLPESEDYETVGGLITSETGRIPEVGEIIEFDEFFARIVDRTTRQIQTVVIKIKDKEEE